MIAAFSELIRHRRSDRYYLQFNNYHSFSKRISQFIDARIIYGSATVVHYNPVTKYYRLAFF